MARRPRPNPRRGVLRAVGVMGILLLVVVGILIVVSILTARTVKAPTVPTAPVPPATPGPLTPGTLTRAPTLPPANTPTPVKGRTATPKPHRAALGGANDTLSFSYHSGGELARRARVGHELTGMSAASPDGRYVAFIRQTGAATPDQPLTVMNRVTRAQRVIGSGDRFVRPVWSPSGASLLYVKAQQVAGIPGVRWTLLLADRVTGRSKIIDRQTALNLIPLGWYHGDILYLVGTASNTSLFRFHGHAASFFTVVISQAVTGASLSPGGDTIAMAVPANCGYCVLNLYSLRDLKLWNGPGGMPNDTDLAWTTDGKQVITSMRGRLTLIDAVAHSSRAFVYPPGLPVAWSHSMTGTLSNHSLLLRDTVSDRSYFSELSK